MTHTPRIAPAAPWMLGARAALMGACAALLGACAATPPPSSRLAVDDFRDFSSELSARLLASDFMAQRGPDSPPIIIAVSKVENLSTDLLSEGERWFIVDRALDDRAIRALRDTHAVRFVIPAEKLKLLRQSLGPQEPVALQRAPTHTLTARLRSLTRSAGTNRTDLYDCEFRVVELSSGEIAWSDHAELKRVAAGRAYN